MPDLVSLGQTIWVWVAIPKKLGMLRGIGETMLLCQIWSSYGRH